MNINDLGTRERLEAIEKDANLIAYIQNPTEYEQAAAVMCNPYLIRCIDHPEKEVIRYCAISDFRSILHIDDLPEDIELNILNSNLEYLEHIKKPWKPHVIEWVVVNHIYCFPFDQIKVPNHLIDKSIRKNLRNANYFENIEPITQRYMLATDIRFVKCIQNIDNAVLMEFIDLIPEENSYALIISDKVCEDAKVFLKMKYGEKPQIDPMETAMFYCPYIPLQMYGSNTHVSAFNTHIPLI